MTQHDTALIRAEVIALREENATLKEALRQMQAAMAPVVCTPRAWRLTTSEEKLLFAIRKASPNVLDRERCLIALYGILHSDMPQQKIIDVFACKLRRKLMEAQTRIQVETVWGRGFRLDLESRARLDEALAGTAELRAEISRAASRRAA